MDQKAFVVLFLILTFIAVMGAVVVRFNDSQKQVLTNPSPTAQPQLFPAASPTPQLQQADQPQQPQQSNQNQSTQNTQLNFQTTPILGTQAKKYLKFPGVFKPEELQNKAAVIQTDKGNIFFEIYTDSPKAASNFIFLAINKFYDGLTFHRVVPGFVIQGGDPLGSGTGGPGYQFEDEPVTKQYTKGTVAMANAGPNTNGSQFFIMLEDNPTLPPNYTIFGKVTLGQEVVNKIQVGDIMQKVSIESLGP